MSFREACWRQMSNIAVVERCCLSFSLS